MDWHVFGLSPSQGCFETAEYVRLEIHGADLLTDKVTPLFLLLISTLQTCPVNSPSAGDPPSSLPNIYPTNTPYGWVHGVDLFCVHQPNLT